MDEDNESIKCEIILRFHEFILMKDVVNTNSNSDVDDGFSSNVNKQYV